MAVVSFIAIKEAHHRAEWVRHTEVVIQELERLISQMKDAETGVRGYIITGDQTILEPYHGAYERTLTSFNKIGKLTEDNREQQETLSSLKRSIDDKYALLKFEITQKSSGRPFDVTLVNQGKRIMDEARSIVNVMEQREQRLLKERTGAWEIYSKITPFLIVIITLLSAVISYYFCSWLKTTYYRKVKLQREIQQRNIETEQRISIIEKIAEKIAGGNYQARVQEEESGVLGSLALSLNRMAISLEYSFEELKALMAKKDDFIGIAAHELKTPLTSIKAYLQFMGRTKLEHTDAVKIYPFIAKANNQVNRLTEIIKDLLDVARINENQLGLKLHTFSLREAIIEVSEELFNAVKTHELVIEGDPDVTIEADKFRIEQVLINLLSNAMKYSPQAKKKKSGFRSKTGRLPCARVSHRFWHWHSER
jgi:signal transduction histidine kinase